MFKKFHRFGEKPNTAIVIAITMAIVLLFGVGLSWYFSREVTRVAWALKTESLLKLVPIQTNRHIQSEFLSDWNSEQAKYHFELFVDGLKNMLPPVAAVKIFNQDTTLIWSTISRDTIGKPQEEESHDIIEAFAEGQHVSLAEPDIERELGSSYLLDIYSPFTLSTGERGVVNVYFDLADFKSFIWRLQALVWILILVTIILTGAVIYTGARAQNRRILRQSRELASIIEHSPIGIFTVTGDGIIDSANPKMSELVENVGRKEFIGKKISEISLYTGTGIDKFLNTCLGGKACEAQTQFSVEGDKKHYQHYYCVPILPAGEKKIEHLLILVSDITDRMTAEEGKKSLDDLKNKFVTIVSHQLRTPLGVTRWNLESVLDEGDGEKIPHEEIIRVAHGATVEVINRINDLMTALDIGENKIRINKETVQLEDLARAIFEEFKPAMNLKKINFNPSWPDVPLPPVEADQARMREVFRKLLDNAIIYNHEGGEITFNFTPKKGKITFEIFDKGIGIPKSEQKHVFERFFRASNAFTAKPDASGLGLYISKSVIEAHGGTIGFKSAEAKGTVFWFELPVI